MPCLSLSSSSSVGCSGVIGEEGVCGPMFGEDPKAAVESLRLPDLAAEVTGAAEEPMKAIVGCEIAAGRRLMRPW